MKSKRGDDMTNFNYSDNAKEFFGNPEAFTKTPGFEKMVMGDIRGYESPIRMIASEIETKMENDTLTAIQRYGIDVDKEELIKALNYDRGQYEKGYADRGNKIVPVTLEMEERHTVRQIKGYLDKATQTIYANWITVECAEAVGWKIKEGDNQ